MISKKAYFRFIIFMLLFSTFFYLLFINLPPIIGSHHLWTIIWFLSIIFLYPKIFKNKLFILLLIYGFFIVLILLNTLWANIDPWMKKQIINEFYVFSVAISVLTYFRLEQDYEGFALIIKWTLLFIFVSAIMSIITAYINPLYARDLTGISAFSESERVKILGYTKYGGGNYSFASALVCLFPMLIYLYKSNDNSIFKKYQILLMGIIFFYALIKMQIVANILVAFIIIILSLLGRKNLKKSIGIYIILLIIIVAIPSHIYAELFYNMATLFDTNSENYFKLNEMGTFFITGGTVENNAINTRYARYPLLIQSFLSNPIWGGKEWNGHLFWMNKLAVYGLLGTLPFIYIIYYYVKKNIKYFDDEFSFYFLLSIFSIIGLGLMKALTGRELWYTFFIILPGFYYLQYLKQPQINKLKHNKYNYNLYANE